MRKDLATHFTILAMIVYESPKQNEQKQSDGGTRRPNDASIALLKLLHFTPNQCQISFQIMENQVVSRLRRHFKAADRMSRVPVSVVFKYFDEEIVEAPKGPRERGVLFKKAFPGSRRAIPGKSKITPQPEYNYYGIRVVDKIPIWAMAMMKKLGKSDGQHHPNHSLRNLIFHSLIRIQWRD